MEARAILTEEQFKAVRRLVVFAETTTSWKNDEKTLAKELADFFFIKEAIKTADEFLLSPTTILENENFNYEITITQK